MSNISPKSFIFLKTFDSEFSYIGLWFTVQNSKPLDIVDNINITLIKPTDQIFVNGYRFLSFAKNMVKKIGKNISKNLNGKYS